MDYKPEIPVDYEKSEELQQVERDCQICAWLVLALAVNVVTLVVLTILWWPV